MRLKRKKTMFIYTYQPLITCDHIISYKKGTYFLPNYLILEMIFSCKLENRETWLSRNLELSVFEISKWNFARGFFEFKFVINLSRFWNLKILVHLLLKLLLIIYQPLRTHVNIFDKFSEFSSRKLWKSKMNLVLNWNACHVKEHNIQALKNSKPF